MAQIEFRYNGTNTIIQCEEGQKMTEICKKFLIKSNAKENDIYFIYDGQSNFQFNKNLTFIQMANSYDKTRKKMNILVYDKNDMSEIDNKITPKNIICPKCNEIIKMKIDHFKINLFECKNNHYFKEITLNELCKSQTLDLRKIQCGKCKEKNKSNTYNNEFYRCHECGINLCPLCKTQHNNTHNIVNYDSIDYLCSRHKDPFIDYCSSCKMNICFLCDEEHEGHNFISLRKKILNKDEIISKLEDFKKGVRILEENIENMMQLLNNVKENIVNYYKLEEYIINNYDKNQRNYEILNNINELIKLNQIIISEIINIKNENKMDNKFKYIFNLYQKINKVKNYTENKKENNEIKLEVKIEEENINKKIYFLDNTDENVYVSAYREEEHHHDFLKELDESNVELYINNKICSYKKYFIPDKEGYYQILLKFNIFLKDCSFMFYNCKNIINIDFSSFITRNTIDMRSMFGCCSQLKNIDLSSFNTENVTNMSCMFSYCSNLISLNLSSFDTKKVKDMDAMFWNCHSLKNINLSSFNTKNVEDICWMFSGCNNLLEVNISSFDIDNVSNFNKIFSGCEKLKELKITKKAYNKIKGQIKNEKMKIIYI